MEMAGVLKATPIEEAAVEFVRAGGDLCLVCRQQEKVEGAFDALCKTVARDPRFRRRVLESAKHIVSFKKKAAGLKRRAITPSSERIRRLSTQLWEFSERVRLQSLSKGAAAGARG
jgi:hypothetical protein